MEPRRFPLGVRLGGWALSLMLALAACTDRELSTAVPTLPDRPSMAAGSGLVSVSAGSDHSCALKIDGTVACWGDNGDGRATPPPLHLHAGERGRRTHVWREARRTPRMAPT